MIENINKFLTTYCTGITRSEAINILEDLKWIKNLSRDELKEIYNNWRKKFMEIEIM